MGHKGHPSFQPQRHPPPTLRPCPALRIVHPQCHCRPNHFGVSPPLSGGPIELSSDRYWSFAAGCRSTSRGLVVYLQAESLLSWLSQGRETVLSTELSLVTLVMVVGEPVGSPQQVESEMRVGEREGSSCLSPRCPTAVGGAWPSSRMVPSSSPCSSLPSRRSSLICISSSYSQSPPATSGCRRPDSAARCVVA